MSIRRSHYELAFEAYLNRRGTPYVAIEDVRHFVKGRLGEKAFDYVVYPSSGRPCLVDVKGRKIPASPHCADARTKNWVTRADLTGLQAWQDVFGAQYRAGFVFGFWLSGPMPPEMPQPPESVFPFAGRHYRFWLAGLKDYLPYHRQLSKRWDTVNISTEAFHRISLPVERAWPSAPC